MILIQQEEMKEEEWALQENRADSQNLIIIEQNKKETEVKEKIKVQPLSKCEESKEEKKEDKKESKEEKNEEKMEEKKEEKNEEKKVFKGIDFGKLDAMGDYDLILDEIGNISIFRFRWSRGWWR